MGLSLFTRFIKIIILFYNINGLTIFSEPPVGFKKWISLFGITPNKKIH